MKVIQERRKLKDLKDPGTKRKRRDQMLRSKYNLSADDYDKMLKKQKNRCKICHRKEGKFKFHVDHCHKTNKVRGILCHQCNWYLGTIDKDIRVLKRLEKYKLNKGDI